MIGVCGCTVEINDVEAPDDILIRLKPPVKLGDKYGAVKIERISVCTYPPANCD